MLTVNKAEIKNILVIRMNRIGDMICTIPLLRTLRKEFPEARLTLLAEATNAEIVENAAYIDELLVYKKGSSKCANRFAATIKLLSGKQFDICVAVKAGFSSSLAIMTFISGARYRVGYVAERFHPARFLYNLSAVKSAEQTHQILQCLRLLRLIGINEKSFLVDCSIDAPETAGQRFGQFLEKCGADFASARLAVINISNNRPETSWSVNNFIELVRGLKAEKINCIVTSVPRDLAAAATIVDACRGAAIYYDTPHIMDFAAAVKRADLLICHDSGAMHIGSATLTPTLVLVGRGIQPEVWGPFGEGHRCISGKAVHEITTACVLKNALSMMRGGNE